MWFAMLGNNAVDVICKPTMQHFVVKSLVKYCIAGSECDMKKNPGKHWKAHLCEQLYEPAGYLSGDRCLIA